MTTKIGILWVDAPQTKEYTTIKDGYICTGLNGDDIERIPLNNLPQQYTWICNLSTDKFKTTNIHTYGNIKNTRFLGVTLSSIIIELALDDDLAVRLPILYRIAQGITDQIENNLNINVKDANYSLLEKIHRDLFNYKTNEKPVLNGLSHRPLELAINNSMQKLQASALQRQNHIHEIYSAHFSKSPFMFTLLNLLYPTSNDYQECHDFEGAVFGVDQTNEMTGEAKLKELVALSESHCGFFKFNQLETLPHVNIYYPLGREVYKSGVREWATLPEIIDMANYSQIELGKGFITKAGRLPNAPKLPNPETVTFNSYIKGLLNSILWQALSYESHEASIVSPISTYVRAYDRIMCRLRSHEFIDEGFEVTGFSGGAIRFMVNKNDKYEIQRLKNSILQKRMVPQFKLIQ